MIGAIVPDDFNYDLAVEAMEVAVVVDEVVVSCGCSTIVLSAAAALETAQRLLLAVADPGVLIPTLLYSLSATPNLAAGTPCAE